MRILFIAPLPPPLSGQSLAAQALFEQLLTDGHDVVPVNMSKGTFRQGVSSLNRVAEVLRFTWCVWRSRRGVDLVYLTSSESRAGNLKDMLFLSVLGKSRSKTWLHLHGGAGMRNLIANRKNWISRLNRLFLGRVAGVIVLGERLAPIFRGYIRPDRICIVKNFAADSLFLDTDKISKKWSDTSVLRVLFLSNLLPGKGHVELLEAVKLLPPELERRFIFDFAGGFESAVDEAGFRAAATHLPNVKLHGVVDGESKRALLAQSHVFCLPTFYPYEGQPISILEAYASGCAVLTTDHSGIFDIFTPGQNGWEVQPRQPSSIVAALSALAAAPSDGAKIAFHNRRIAGFEYTRKAHLRQLYQVVCG